MSDICQQKNIHPEKVKKVKDKLATESFSDLITLGKCFSEPSRIKIFYALETFEEMCVCDLAEILETSIATTSHHLRYFKKNELVKTRKQGKEVYYSFRNEETSNNIYSILNLPNTLSSVSVV